MLDPSSSPTEVRLREAVEDIYRQFAEPAPSQIEGCPCCVSTRGADILLSKPLRDLTGQELSRYVSSAFLTIGNEHDFRYLLPRILDVSVSDPETAAEPEIVLSKLALANWRSWSIQEQGSVEEFVNAWFETALMQDLADAEAGWIDTKAESVLCGAARAGLPLRHWLIRLHEPVVSPVLTDLKERFPGQLSAFWEDAPEGFRELSMILAQGRA